MTAPNKHPLKSFSLIGGVFFHLVSFAIHQPYNILLCVDTTIPTVQVSSVQWERQDEIPGDTTELSLNGYTRRDWC